ncbi:hypothetical protein [Sodalis sp.]|uniref:hypothetical protein n=1 Tax=Sodalis sp. (in: enterobacteria) TaxID=1898979 RepID=UPI0038737DD6
MVGEATLPPTYLLAYINSQSIHGAGDRLYLHEERHESERGAMAIFALSWFQVA